MNTSKLLKLSEGVVVEVKDTEKEKNRVFLRMEDKEYKRLAKKINRFDPGVFAHNAWIMGIVKKEIIEDGKIKEITLPIPEKGMRVLCNIFTNGKILIALPRTVLG